MKRWSNAVRNFMFVVALVSIGLFGIKKITAYWFGIERIEVVLDSRIADGYKQQIIDTINEVQKKGDVSAQDLIALVKQQFSCIKSVALSYVPTGVMHIEARVYEPLCFVNHAQVLLRNGQLAEPILFNSTYLALLYNVMVADDYLEENYVFAELKECVQKIPTSLWSAYELEWVNENQLILRDKQQRNFAIVCESIQLPDTEQLTRCNKIKHDLEKNGTLSVCNKKQWIADVRFENQIVVSGGICNGKSIS